MPTYDYRCEANGEVIEAKHRMNESAATWGELCLLTGRSPGALPIESAVTRLATGGQVVKSSALTNPDTPPCATGPCCGGGGCGL